MNRLMWFGAGAVLTLLIPTIVVGFLPQDWDFPGRWCEANEVRSICLRDWLGSYAGWAAVAAAVVTIPFLLAQTRVAQLGLNDQRRFSLGIQADGTRAAQNYANLALSQAKNILANHLSDEAHPRPMPWSDENDSEMFKQLQLQASYDVRLYFQGLSRAIEDYRKLPFERHDHLATRAIREKAKRIKTAAKDVVNECEQDLRWLRPAILRLEDTFTKRPPREVRNRVFFPEEQP
ncbi:MAG: hypothetical protein R3D70_00825 [Rhizobiaceae bacterium]